MRNYLRVFTGALRGGDSVQGTRGAVPFSVDELWSMHASHHELVATAWPGEIVVLPGDLGLQTGETLYRPGALRRLPMPQFSPPVIGALFRSSQFQTDRTELVFVITPRLVKPLPADYKLPTDGYVPPTRSDVILHGRTEGKRDADAQPSSKLGAPKALARNT